MRVNMTITLPDCRLRFRGTTPSGSEYRKCIAASLGISDLPRAGKKHFHQIHRLAGLVTVRAILVWLRQQVEAGFVCRVRHVFSDGDSVLFGRVQICVGRRAETDRKSVV